MNTPTSDSTALPSADPVLVCVGLIAELKGVPLPRDPGRGAPDLGDGFAHRADGRLAPSQWPAAAEAMGLAASFASTPLTQLQAHALPVVLLLQDDQACVLLRGPNANAARASERDHATVLWPESGPVEQRIAWDTLLQRHSGQVLHVGARAVLDTRGDFEERVSPSRWFWDILKRYRSDYAHVALATVVVNVLALAGSIFAMIVYDRVVPNQAYDTLWALALGVTVAALFEYAARMLRATLTDSAGKKADIQMSSLLFRRLLGLRLDQRPTSAGSFANTLREFETVRDFVTSATLLAMADMPFVLFFLAIMVVMVGSLAWVPAVAMVLVLAVTLAAQWPIAKLTAKTMRGMSRKQSIAVEAIEGLEALKANRAEGLMQAKWDESTGAMALHSAQSRHINAWVTGFVNVVQQISMVVLIVWGVYRIHDNGLTMGGLIAASILAGRVLAPVSQVAALGLRWQQARTALQGLNELMRRPQAREATQDYVQAPSIVGRLQLGAVSYRFGEPTAPKVLDSVQLDLQPGATVAVLGKVGSGKSTLLRVAAGLLPASEGVVSLDGLDVRQLEPSTVRQSIAYLGQDAQLFHGSLRENILLGLTGVSAARLSHALAVTGLDRTAAAHPRGLDMPIGEHGQGLSGGQRQLVALARLLVRDPRVVLLDEPTSAMDNGTEAQIMKHLQPWLQGRSLVLVTHRLHWVNLVERVVVLDAGRVVADGPRDAVMQRLAQGIAVPPVRVAKG